MMAKRAEREVRHTVAHVLCDTHDLFRATCGSSQFENNYFTELCSG